MSEVFEEHGTNFGVSKTLELKSFLPKGLAMSDFKQDSGYGNCALMSSLAGISQRSEFRTEIAPEIRPTTTEGGLEFRFRMFLRGKPVVVTTTDGGNDGRFHRSTHRMVRYRVTRS